MRSKLVLITFIAVTLRLALAASSFHPDVRAFDLGGQFVAAGHVFNLYDYLANLPGNDLLARNYPSDLFIYPPLIYLFHGFFALLLGWLVNYSVIFNFLTNTGSILGNWQLNLHLLLLKAPYLIFDIPVGFLLFKMMEKPREKMLAFLLWMFNPVTLHSAYLMGQFDIIPTSLVVFSLYLIQRKEGLQKLSLAALILGLGVAVKIFPLFLLVPFISLGKNWGERVKLSLIMVIPYLITVGPFLLSRGYRSSALVAGQILKSFYLQLPISGGENIIIFLAALVFFYLLFLRGRGEIKTIWSRFYIVLLLFFIFTHYHPQWFVWLTPFLIIDLVKSEFKNLLQVVLMVGSYFCLLFFFDPSLTIGLFSPVAPSLFNTPSLWQLLHLSPDYNLCRSVLQTIFVGAALYSIYLYFPRKTETSEVS